MAANYREYHEQLIDDIRHLRKRLPGPMGGFGQLHRAAVSGEGELDARHKELIAVGIAVVSHCEACIALHVRAALRAGATPGEILETIGVAILMGGGPAMTYGLEAARALDEFTNMPMPHPD